MPGKSVTLSESQITPSSDMLAQNKTGQKAEGTLTITIELVVNINMILTMLNNVLHLTSALGRDQSPSFAHD